VTIEPLAPQDWPAVRAVYEAGIATGDATFETEAPSWEAWDAAHLPEHRFVARAPDGSVAGWAAATAVSDRCAYAGVVESSVYVDPRWHGHGIGRMLLDALVASTEAAGVWTVQTGSSPRTSPASGSTRRAASVAWA
jgi:L-amino acid N-acyltransferase YncA